jgi:hypothetical protein
MAVHVQVRQHFTNDRKRTNGKIDDAKIVNALVYGPPDHREALLKHYKNTARMKHLQMLMRQLTENPKSLNLQMSYLTEKTKTLNLDGRTDGRDFGPFEGLAFGV